MVELYPRLMGFDALKRYILTYEVHNTLYGTDDYIEHQLMLLLFFCIDNTPEDFKRKQTIAVHTISFIIICMTHLCLFYFSYNLLSMHLIYMIEYS